MHASPASMKKKVWGKPGHDEYKEKKIESQLDNPKLLLHTKDSENFSYINKMFSLHKSETQETT